MKLTFLLIFLLAEAKKWKGKKGKNKPKAPRTSYNGIKFLHLANIVPSNALIDHYEPSHRPLELKWLQELQDVNSDIVDLNIAKMIIRNDAAFVYTFAIQVIYKNSQVQSADITQVFSNVEWEKSAVWDDIMDQYVINFQTPGLLHGTCETAESECRDMKFMADFCYKTHLIPFDESDSSEYNAREEWIRMEFNESWSETAFAMDNEADIKIMVNSITSNFSEPEVTDTQVVKVGEAGQDFHAVWHFTKKTWENIYHVCVALDIMAAEQFGDVTPVDAFLMATVEASLAKATNNTYDKNSLTLEYSYMCVAPECNPVHICDTNDHGCDHHCTKMAYNYKCTCNATFEIDDDGVTCNKITTTTTTTTLATTTPATTTTDANGCPPKGTFVDWQGAKSSKIIFSTFLVSRVWTRVNFQNKDLYNTKDSTYIGFLGFSRRLCGADFLKALGDGRVEMMIHDLDDYYTQQYQYERNDGRKSSVVIQFYRHTVGDVELETKKGDQLYLSFTGLNTVDFAGKRVGNCLTKAQAGTKQITLDVDPLSDMTLCAAWDKDLVWKPSNRRH